MRSANSEIRNPRLDPPISSFHEVSRLSPLLFSPFIHRLNCFRPNAEPEFVTAGTEDSSIDFDHPERLGPSYRFFFAKKILRNGTSSQTPDRPPVRVGDYHNYQL